MQDSLTSSVVPVVERSPTRGSESLARFDRVEVLRIDRLVVLLLLLLLAGAGSSSSECSGGGAGSSEAEVVVRVRVELPGGTGQSLTQPDRSLEARPGLTHRVRDLWRDVGRLKDVGTRIL